MKKTEFIDTVLPFVSKASRYLGNEINAVQKDWAAVDLRVALAFPDVYEVGMSHLGFQILYSILNNRPDIACERVFTPWIDMEAALREQGIPLCSLESSVPLRDFHILGFSLQYELSYTNILKMLSLAGIPLHADQRDERYHGDLFEWPENLLNLYRFQSRLIEIRFHLAQFVTAEMVHETVVTGKIRAAVGKSQDQRASRFHDRRDLAQGRPIIRQVFQYLRTNYLRK